MRIGILGGTFNPVHNAHLQIAALARDVLSLDLVLLMVAADPPHKKVAGATDGADRLEMVRLAAAPLDHIEASDLELRRAGKSYTRDTLQQLHDAYKDAELFFLIGSDMLLNFPSWYHPEEIAALSTLVVTPRIGEDAQDAVNAALVREKYSADVIFLPAGADEISSTAVRQCIQGGLPVSRWLPRDVEQYAMEHGLYFLPEVRLMQEKLKMQLKPSRYRHSCGTVSQAAILAQLWGADPKKVQIAALLHDCAKNLPQQELERISGDTFVVAPVLHAHAGAVVANTEYGVTDAEILRAIRLHATGDRDMTVLDMVIYLSDITEPNRDFDGVDEIRAMLPAGPDQAMLFALTRNREAIIQRELPFHPATLRAIEYFSEKMKEGNH